mgnify:CR=1 FL=1
MYWLNCTVSPETYKIEYWVNDEFNASAKGSLAKQYPNTVVDIKIYDENNFLKVSDRVTLTHDVVRNYVFPQLEYGKVHVEVFDENGVEKVADRICLGTTCVTQKHEYNFSVYVGEDYDLIVEKSGYKTLNAHIIVYSDYVYVPVFLANESAPANTTSGIGGVTEEPETTPPEPGLETWFGFKFISKASVAKNITIKAKKKGAIAFHNWYYEVPVKQLTINPGAVEYVWLSEDEVNEALGYNWFEWGESFVIYVDGSKYTEIPMNTAKNAWVTIWVTEYSGNTFAYGAFTSGGTGVEQGNIVSLVVSLIPLFIILAIISMIFKMIQKLAR